MSASPIPKLLTIEDLEAIPDPPGGRYELHHGEAVFVSFPDKKHKELQRRLRKLLEEFVATAKAQGVVDTEFPYRPFPEHELWGADVAWCSQARYDRVERWLEGSPELVIEVKSPSNTKQELHDRAMTAIAGGAQEFWIVDLDKQVVVVYERSSGMSQYSTGQAVPVSMFDARIKVDQLFEGL